MNVSSQTSRMKKIGIKELCTLTNQLVQPRDYAPMCPMEVNGIKVNALVDSGNTISNAISEKFAKTLGLKKEDIEILPDLMTVGTAKRGQTLEILGRPKRSL